MQTLYCNPQRLTSGKGNPMSKESDGYVRAIARGFSNIEALGETARTPHPR
jgi:hypothetical protein